MMKLFIITLGCILFGVTTAKQCKKLPGINNLDEPKVFCSFEEPDLCVGVSPGTNPSKDIYLNRKYLQLKRFENNWKKEETDNKIEWVFRCEKTSGEYHLCLHKYPEICVSLFEKQNGYQKVLLPLEEHKDDDAEARIIFDVDQHTSGHLRISTSYNKCVTVSDCEKIQGCRTSESKSPEIYSGLYLTDAKCNPEAKYQRWTISPAPVYDKDGNLITGAPSLAPTDAPSVKPTAEPTTTEIKTETPTREPSAEPTVEPTESKGDQSIDHGNRGQVKDESNEDGPKGSVGSIIIILIVVLLLALLYVLRKRCARDSYQERSSYEQHGPLVGEHTIKFDRKGMTTIPLDDRTHYVDV